MQLDQNPYFRKAITPWYDSNFACWTVVVLMIFVFIFAVAGIIVAGTNPYFSEHAWVPVFLAGISFYLMLKIIFRLKKRSKNN